MLRVDKILFVGSCTYLLGVLAWLGSNQKLSFFFHTSEITATNQELLHQAEFIAYLQSSLRNLDTHTYPSEEIPLTAEDIAEKPKPERVYIPLYQPPTIITQPAPPVPKTTLPPPPPPSSAVASTPEVPESPSTDSTNDNGTLVGWLVVDNQAIALFATADGVTHRVKVGEEIGSTGWTLLDIINEQAIVQKLQQKKHIKVGQAF